MQLITTSWDDGDVLDFKLAGLLKKYNLPATFYIPKSNAERPVMSEGQVRELATDFEIGGHGINHLRLASKDKAFLLREIDGSYHWLGDVVGQAPVSFCFPGGVYNAAAVKIVFDSGYKLARTTQLFSTSPYSPGMVTATSLQAYPHSGFTYVKHLTKRKLFATLVKWIWNGSETDLCKLTELYLADAAANNGCFHLWGHSWEIEEYNLWSKLESIFKILSNHPQFSYVENRELIEEPNASFVNTSLKNTRQTVQDE